VSRPDGSDERAGPRVFAWSWSPDGSRIALAYDYRDPYLWPFVWDPSRRWVFDHGHLDDPGRPVQLINDSLGTRCPIGSDIVWDPDGSGAVMILAGTRDSADGRGDCRLVVVDHPAAPARTITRVSGERMSTTIVRAEDVAWGL
jgi:hypothetical protein